MARRKKSPVQFDLFGHPIEETRPQAGGLMPLDFEGERIRAVTIKGNPWFVAADVCRLLGLEAGARHVRSRLDADDIRTVAEACGTTDDIKGLRFDALLESIAREMADADLRRLGPGYQYGIEVDSQRGRIIDAIQPQLEVA